MALSAAAVGLDLENRTLRKLHYAIANDAEANSTVATGDALVTYDASDNYEPKYSLVTEVMTGALNGATLTEINRATDVSGRLVAGGSALTVTEALHDGKTILLDTAAGTTCTLPAATASGMRLRFVISVIATSNSHIIKVVGNDIMQGFCLVAQDGGDTAVMFETAADSDTITLNRTTTGSTQIGEWFELEDIKTDTWAVRGSIAATGTEATPFSATV